MLEMQYTDIAPLQIRNVTLPGELGPEVIMMSRQEFSRLLLDV